MLRTRASQRTCASFSELDAFAAYSSPCSVPEDELSGSIRIVGTDTMKELMGRWVVAFSAPHRAIHIELTANGALTAAPARASGTPDLAPLGREFTPTELAVFHMLREGILGEKNGSPTSVLTRIVEDIAKDPNAIGYAGFHPLTRFLYIYVDRPAHATLAPAVREFLRYVPSLDGQRAVEHEGIFMPLPARIAAEQRAKLE